MKPLLSVLAFVFTFSVLAEEVDLVSCKLEHDSAKLVKLTKTHDAFYTLYLQNTADAEPKWEKVLDLGAPVVWTRSNGEEVADFYYIDGFNYNVRLLFDKAFQSLGNGEITKLNENGNLQKFAGFVECKGELK